jgi:hypothetical protein
MPEDPGRSQYRLLIDALVDECRNGQVLPGWVRRGVWNRYAEDHPEEMPEEHRMNILLARLDDADRDALAFMIEKSYEGAVHNTLGLLHDSAVPPFDAAYEGTPAHDFMGRLMTDWEWPT